MADEEKKAGSLLRNLLVLIVLVGGLAAWTALTAGYQLQPGEEAVILRLGKFHRVVDRDGIGVHLPYPIETHSIVNTTELLQEEFGNVPNAAKTKVETVMQTGDNAIVLLEFVVRYKEGESKAHTLSSGRAGGAGSRCGSGGDARSDRPQGNRGNPDRTPVRGGEAKPRKCWAGSSPTTKRGSR